MNSVEFQAVIHYLEVLRLEQKKTSEIVTGVGVLIIIIGSLLVFWK